MSASLDDFFAKKDKKKKKTSKFTGGDLLSTEETEIKKKTKKKTKESEPTPAGNTEPAKDTAAELGEEWTEYVEEKETDYSGLRIQSIQIRDEDADAGNVNQDKDGDGEDGDEGEDRADTTSGPWNTSTIQPPPKEDVEPPPPQEPVAPPAPVKSGGYVIPSKRNAPSAGPDPLPQSRYRRKKEAPNLKSEEDFPTLGGGPPEDAASAWGSGRFEKVRSGGRQMDEQTSRGPRLELGNKYDALRGGAD